MIKPPARATAAPVPDDARRTLLEVAVALSVIGIALRAAYITQPMRYDEAVTYIYFADQAWATLLSSYQYPNNHILHSVLVKLSTSVFGGEPWAIRLPAFVAGVALIPATLFTGVRLVGLSGASFGAALVATSGTLVLFSTNARGYSMVCLATVLLLHLLLQLRTRASTGRWIAVALVIALGMWTIPVMLYPVTGLALWFAVSALVGDTSNKRRDLASLAAALLGAALLTGAAYAPVLFDAGSSPLVANAFVTPRTWDVFIAELTPMLRGIAAAWSLGLPAIVATVLALVVIVGAVVHWRQRPTRVPVMGAMLFAACVVLVAMQRAPFVRVWLFLFAPVALVCGAGLAWLASRGAAAFVRRVLSVPIEVVLAFVLALTVWRSHAVTASLETGTLRDAPAIATWFQSALKPGDHIIAPIPSNAPLQYAFLRAGLDTTAFATPDTLPPNVYLVVNSGEGFTSMTPISGRWQQYFTGAELVSRFPAAEVYRLR